MEDKESKNDTILVVDDEAAVRDFIRTTLKRQPFDLQFAKNGREALEKFRQHAPILVLLDLKMPRYDGLHFLREIHHRPEDPYSILVLTGLGDDHAAKQCYDMGINFFIRKPFGRLELEGVVNQSTLLTRLRNELRSKNELIERQRDEMREWLHILCHDLTTTIGGVSSAFEISANEPEMLEEMRHDIEASLSNGLKVIEVIRKMRSLENAQSQIALEPVALTDAFRRASFVMRSKLLDKNIRLRDNVREEDIVLAEPNSLVNSVLLNLISNAVKFSFPDGEITADSRRQGSFIEFTIRDQGIGIPAVLVPDLFHMRKSARRPGTDGEIGIGFGMPLVKKCMDAYGGQVHVESKDRDQHPQNHGTTFTLRFRPPE